MACSYRVPQIRPGGGTPIAAAVRMRGTQRVDHEVNRTEAPVSSQSHAFSRHDIDVHSYNYYTYLIFRTVPGIGDEATVHVTTMSHL